MHTKASLCALPFLQLSLEENGTASPCCRLPERSLGKTGEKGADLLKLWDSAPMRELRKEFLSGHIRTCRRQIDRFGCNSWNSHLLPQVVRSEKQHAGPRKILVHSSALGRVPASLLPGLIEIEVHGGDTLEQESVLRFINKVHKVNKNCSWLFTTYGQWRSMAKVKPLLERVKIKRIAMKIDSLIPETYSRMHNRGTLKRALANLDSLLEWRRSRHRPIDWFDLHFCMRVSVDNWQEMRHYVFYAATHGIHPVLMFLDESCQGSLAGLPRSERAKIYARLMELRWGSAEEAVRPVLHALRETLKDESRLERLAESYRLSRTRGRGSKAP